MQVFAWYLQQSSPTVHTPASIIAMTDLEMESSHDWVQWAFPNEIPSKAVIHSPVASLEEIQRIGQHPECWQLATMILHRYMDFLKSTGNLRKPLDHNRLRVTRILRFLALAGHKEKAKALYALAMEETLTSADAPKYTWPHWQDAMRLLN